MWKLTLGHSRGKTTQKSIEKDDGGIARCHEAHGGAKKDAKKDNKGTNKQTKGRHQ